MYMEKQNQEKQKRKMHPAAIEEVNLRKQNWYQSVFLENNHSFYLHTHTDTHIYIYVQTYIENTMWFIFMKFAYIY